MRRLCVAGLLAAALSLALLVPLVQGEAAAKPVPVRVKHTGGPVSKLAMDGPRVAYLMGRGGPVYVWNVVTGATSVTSYGVDAAQLAFAGKRIAWIKRQDFGNTEEGEKLYSGPVAGRAHLLKRGYLFSRDDAAHTSGGWIGGVVGSGEVLAVSTWTSQGTVSSDERLSLITPTRMRPIVTGPGAIVAESVNGGHIAVLRSTAAWPADEPATPATDPTVGIYSVHGSLLREIVLRETIPPPTPSECGCSPSTVQNSVALSGNQLVVLTVTYPQPGGGASQGTTTLQVYDWTTGSLVHTWPVAFTPYASNSAPPLSAYGRFAAVEGRQLHVIDLATGKEILLAPASGTGSPAVIDARGLVYTPGPNGPYAYNGPGKIVFVPMANLLTAASR